MKFADKTDALYSILETDDGQRFLPSPLTGGPWNAQHQHGGAVAGLLTRALDQLDSPVPMRLTRITVEMFRGVPLKPLRIETDTLRAGRRIQSVEARLYHEEVIVARATALRVRRDEELAELLTPAERDPDVGDPHRGFDRPQREFPLPDSLGFVHALEIRSELPEESGRPASTWARLRCPFMDHEETSPIVQLATLADLASGTGNAMDYEKYTSINPDLTIHVLREPQSDWIGIRGITLRASDGIGQSASLVYDLEGQVAQVGASLLLSRR